jgi:ketosteroid isomerase-like protein
MMHTWKDMTMRMSFTSIKKKMKDTISDEMRLTELGTHDVELMEEEPDPSKKRLQKLKHVVEK